MQELPGREYRLEGFERYRLTLPFDIHFRFARDLRIIHNTIAEDWRLP